MSERKRRKRWTAEDKLRIVLSGMESGTEISELCRREGINPTQYYAWKKTLMSSAAKVFNGAKDKPDVKQQRLESDLSRCKDVIAEITAENLDLKKTLSD